MLDLNIYNLLSLTVLRIIVAIVILLLGIIFGSFFGKLTIKFLQETELSKILSKEKKPHFKVEHTLSLVVKYLVYLVAIILALNELNLASTILCLLLGLLALLLLLFAFLSIRDFLPNFFAGFSIRKKKMFKIGDYVSVSGIEGRIIRINSAETLLKTKKGERLFVPNSLFTKKSFRLLK
jgi:small conductance mechanosensitive channel